MIFSRHLTLADICTELGCSTETLSKGVDFYNADFSGYGNEVYKEVSSRAAHWLNFQHQDWFSKRLSYYLDNYGDYDLVIDLGYSVPYVYARPDIAWSTTSFLFVDKYASSWEFHEVIQRLLGVDRPHDEILIGDIEERSTLDQIVSAIDSIDSKSILVVGSEVVEHLREPDCFWSIVGDLAARAKKLDCFVTLPIGHQIPSHTMQFLSCKEAMIYINRYIDPRHEGRLIPTPSESSTYLQSCVWTLGKPRP